MVESERNGKLWIEGKWAIHNSPVGGGTVEQSAVFHACPYSNRTRCDPGNSGVWSLWRHRWSLWNHQRQYARRNLFHSFQQFSLPNGDAANFITNATIQNVIVRVTGVGQPFISNINGAIATSNPANFFLLNPNGIIFGPGAALDIRGSFLATTADRMQFQDGVEFRTTDPAPLLTINVPIGLGFTGVLKPIQMRSSFFSPNVGDDFRDFVLVGGNISLDDTEVTTPGRRVELAAIGAPGTVGLAVSGNSLRLSLSDNLSRADYPC